MIAIGWCCYIRYVLSVNDDVADAILQKIQGSAFMMMPYALRW